MMASTATDLAFLAPLPSSIPSSSTFCPSFQNHHAPYLSSTPIDPDARVFFRLRRGPRRINININNNNHIRCCADGNNNGNNGINEINEINEIINDNKLERGALEQELKKLEGTKLKWAEIEFPDVQSELAAIDEYVISEGISEGDCWPIFLRACAYERVGQSRLALAQLGMVISAAGLSMVPNLWERRAYNTFKVGDILKADALYDVSIRILTEAIGNELHFAHWFDDNFSHFLPVHNGPSFAIQRGISKFCIGDFAAARSALVPALIVRDIGCEHGALWLIASSLKPGTESVPYGIRSDLTIIDEWRSENSSITDTLNLCIDIFLARAKDPDVDLSSQVDNLKRISTHAIDVRDSTTALIYLALYYDAIDRDVASRDLYLDIIANLPGSPSCTDSLDFVYHASKYRFGDINTKS